MGKEKDVLACKEHYRLRVFDDPTQRASYSSRSFDKCFLNSLEEWFSMHATIRHIPDIHIEWHSKDGMCQDRVVQGFTQR